MAGDALQAVDSAPAAPADSLASLTLRLREAESTVDEERCRADRLAELSSAKSRFLSLASHELRSPLTVLMGNLSLLEQGAFGDVPEGFANTLPALNARLCEMEGFINAMLETSRLDDDRFELLRAPVDLRETVQEALQRSEVFAHPGQRLSLRLPDRPVVVDGDRSRLVMAVANLVQNAIKFSVDGGDVRTAVSSSRMSACVSVSDDGIGIAPQDQALLFSRFGRVRRDPQVSRLPGTGLGLYLAREIARAHGGDVDVVSEPGSGSTFTLTLPLTA